MPLPIPPNPVLLDQAPSLMAQLEIMRQKLKSLGIQMFDFGSEDPRDPAWVGIREGIRSGVPDIATYPDVEGLRKFRESAAGWLKRRFDVKVAEETQILPTSGGKEAIFHMPFVFVHPSQKKRIVVFGEPGYSAYRTGALYAGGEVYAVPLRREQHHRLELDDVPTDILKRTALAWLNYPHNPTGATADKAYFSRILQAAQKYGFVVCSDEVYADSYSHAPPPSILQLSQQNVVAFFSLSQRSGIPGYRSGFVCGDPEIISLLRRFRPEAGLRQPVFIQEAAIAAWGNDTHTVSRRETIRAKRDLFVTFCGSHNIEVTGGEDTPYLWIACPPGVKSEAYALELLHAGLVVVPGTCFGALGEGHIRIALLPPLEECKKALQAWAKIIR